MAVLIYKHEYQFHSRASGKWKSRKTKSNLRTFKGIFESWADWSAVTTDHNQWPLTTINDHLIDKTITLESHPKSSNHERHDDVTLLVTKLEGEGKQHQHVVTLRHAQCVKVTEYVGTSNLPLYSVSTNNVAIRLEACVPHWTRLLWQTKLR